MERLRPETNIWDNLSVDWLRAEWMSVREEVPELEQGVVGGIREKTGTDLATHEPIESISFAHGKHQRSPNPYNYLRSNDDHFYKRRITLQTYLMAKDKENVDLYRQERQLFTQEKFS